MNVFLQEILEYELEILSEIFDASDVPFQIFEIEISNLDGENFKFTIGKENLPKLEK